MIADDVTCPTCSIELEVVASLTGTELVGQPVFVQRRRSGEYLLSAYLDRQRFLVYGPTGEYLNAVGRRGGGPGEFTNMDAAVLVGDTLMVFDHGQQRISRVSLTDLTIRVGRFPMGNIDQVVETDIGIVLSGTLPAAQRIGLPLHLVDSQDQVAQSFGSGRRLYRPDAPYLGFRALAYKEKALWVGDRTGYRIERWGIQGDSFALSGSWTRASDWFEPYLVRDPISPESPPQPWLNVVAPLEDSVVLVVVVVADEEFKDKVKLFDHSSGGRPVYDLQPCRRLHDSIIEVLDLEVGSVLARRRFDDCILGPAAEGQFYAYRQSDDGTPTIDIVELKFRQQ